MASSSFVQPPLAISFNDVIEATILENASLDPNVFDCTKVATIAADTDALFTPEIVCQLLVGVVVGGVRRNCFPNSFLSNRHCTINSPLSLSIWLPFKD